MAEVDENTAAINQEAIARADADSANASLIETVRAESNQSNQDLRAMVVDESNARVDADRVLAERVTGVEVITNPDMIGSTDDLIGSESGNAGTWSILSAVQEGDLFQAQRTDLLTVSVNNNAANILTEQTARVSADDALSERIDSLNVEFNGNTASINQKLQSLADVDQALTSEISGMNTRVGANEANIISESQARSTGDVANAQALTDYRSINDTALANVRQTAESAVTATSANTQAVQALDSRVTTAEGNANTAKTNAATALTKAETATTQAGSAASLASQASAIANQAADTADTANQTAATALSTANVAATQSGANATRLDAITLELGNKASTGALSQTNAKVAEHEGKISANTTKIDGVYAQVNPKLIGSTDDFIGSTEGFAGVWSLQSALIEGDMAQAQRTDQVVATISENDALYKQQIKANADAVSANVKATTTLQTTVGQNTASIQEVSQSVNGLYAQKYIKLDVNGKVAGWGGANDGIESNFIVNFDSFAIGSGNNASCPFIFRNTPFTDPVTGTVFPVGAYLKSTFIDYASIDTANIKALAVTTAQIDDLAVKTSKIDNAAITTAKIGDAQVKTLKIDGEAVTAISNISYAQYTRAKTFVENTVVEAAIRQIKDNYTSNTKAWLIGEPFADFTVSPEGGGVQVDITANTIWYSNALGGGSSPVLNWICILFDGGVRVAQVALDTSQSGVGVTDFVRGRDNLSMRWILKGIPNNTRIRAYWVGMNADSGALAGEHVLKANSLTVTVTSVKR